MTEAMLSRYLARSLAGLQRLGVIAWWLRSNSGAVGRVRLAPAGTPDFIVAARKGRTYWIEMKAADGKQSEAQIVCQSRLEKAGHTYIVLNSVNTINEFVERL